MPDEQVKVTVSADTRPYQRELKKAADATSGIEKAQDQLRRQRVNNAVAWAAAGAAVTAVGAKMISVLGDAVAAASDLQESTSKMRVIFGAASADVEEFGKTSATALGMSKRAAYDAAAMMATFGKAAGLTGKDLSKFSLDMVSLSSDLASFYNTSPEDAMEALGAALRGEAEPIRRYGVLLDDATLRQRALAEGLIATTKEALTPQQRALAAQAEILAQTSDAQGDFARTSDGLANSQRKATAAVAEAKAALGEALIPLMTKGANAVATLAGGFAALPKPVQGASALLLGVAGSAALLAPALIGTWKGLNSARTALAEYRKAAVAATVATDAMNASAGRGGAKGLATSAVAAVGPIAALAVAVGGLALAAKTMADNDMADQIDAMSAALDDAIIAGTGLSDAISVDIRGGFGRTVDFDPQIRGIEGLVAALDRGKAVADQVKPAFEALDTQLAQMSPDAARREFDALVTAVEASGGSVDALKANLPSYIGLTRDAARAAVEQADSEKDKAKSVDEANKAQQTALDLLTGYINAQLAAAGSADALIGATGRLRKANEDNGDALSDATVKSAANREALRSEIGLVLANANAKVEQAKAAGKDTVEAYAIGNAAIKEGRAALREAAVAAGYNADEVDKLLRKYMKIPKDKKTQIEATGIDSATGKVKDYRGVLRDIPRSITTRFNFEKGKVWNPNLGAWMPGEQKRAGGGKIYGPGTSTSDSVPLRASAGEWVIQESSASKYGDAFMAAVNAGTLRRAEPGSVYSPAAAASGPSVPTIDARGWTFNGMDPRESGVSVVNALAEAGYRQGVR